jgi:uncharacterized repeat protein (TIGR03803 family)
MLRVPICCAVLLAGLAAAAPASAYTFQTDWTFAGAPDGDQPFAGVTFFQGLLYGTTIAGGLSTGGTVYSIRPGSSLSVIHSLTANTEGAGSVARLLRHGPYLYGTAQHGGAGFGTVFRTQIASPHATTARWTFTGGADGANPTAPVTWLVTTQGGAFFGSTFGGGAGFGTIFRLAGTSLTTLYSFQGQPDGNGPNTQLVYHQGFLYGTTNRGGTSDSGTIFKIDPNPPYALTIVHNILGGTEGAAPNSRLLFRNPYFYGTNLTDGTNSSGTAFRVTPAGAYTVIHQFGAGNDGTVPRGDLAIYGGKLFGASSGGGMFLNGTIFEMNLNGSLENVVHDFTGGADGSAPYSGLDEYSSVLYGTTSAGGTSGHGTLFQFQ